MVAVARVFRICRKYSFLITEPRIGINCMHLFSYNTPARFPSAFSFEALTVYQRPLCGILALCGFRFLHDGKVPYYRFEVCMTDIIRRTNLQIDHHFCSRRFSCFMFSFFFPIREQHNHHRRRQLYHNTIPTPPSSITNRSSTPSPASRSTSSP